MSGDEDFTLNERELWLPRCILCTAEVVAHHENVRGAFLRCTRCDLVFLDPARWPSVADELARYGHHRNTDDAGHRAFLARLGDPVLERTAPGAAGLDYGCGPGPVLARMLSDEGRPTETFDPVFYPDRSPLSRTYDFIVCSEVLEHVHHPAQLFDEFARLVRPGGMIGIMTGMRDAVQSFGDWWYIRDITHVCFYSRATMRWIADQRGWSVDFPAENVSVFTV